MAAPQDDYVSANYRYIAAYNEVTGRIAQRQQSLTLFITLTLGLLASLVASHNLGAPAALYARWILCGFPVAAACLTFLNFKYERTITNLRRFLAELEKLNNSENTLPGYNLQPHWAETANTGRRWHDYTCATLITASNVAAIGIFYVLYGFADGSGWLLVMTGLIAVAAVIFQFRIGRLSYRPLQD